ncbi:MAG: AsmA-like C-terminal domain-containing protein [Desulfobacterales bacterium]|nr:AsmA-like C-terminal domain-containing protein [Desulfobacterales bacterium]
MTRFKKIFLWITACFIFCAAIIFILILSSDKLINQKQILDKIQSGVSEAINGQVTFERIHVSFFPRPQIVVKQCRFSIPETIKGTVVSLSISPKLLPLIMGEFQNSRMTLNTPDIEIYLNRKPKSEDEHLNSFSLGTVEEKVAAILSVILSKTPGLRVRLKNARLNIVKEKKPAFWLQDINASINVLKDHISLNMRCDASLCKNISLKGAVYLYKDRLSLSLANLKLDYPRLNLSGKLDIHRALPSTSPKVNLELMGKDVDVGSTRKAVLDLAGEIPVVNDIFKIVKGGKVPLIQFTSHGKSMKELGELENITIKSNITSGEIFVPGVDLDLTDVAGDVTILKGILKGKNLKARMGTSKCLDGSLDLGLEGKDALFHLDLTLGADLSQLPPILKRVVHNEAFIKENSLVDNVKGRATGRLVLGESLASINVFVDVSQFNLSANYRQLPHPLTINGGRYFMEGNTSSIKNASGSMGNSTFTEVSGQMNWDDIPQLKIASGRAKIDLEDIYPWLLSSKTIAEKLQDLKNVKGILALSSMSLNGPFLEPINYQFQIAGEVRNLTLDSPLLPGSLAAPKGKFSITSENISMTDVQTRIHDTSLKVSGTIKDYLKGLSGIDMTFQGEIGPDLTRWAEDAFNISPILRLKPPISVSTAHLTWNNQHHTAFSGDLSIKKGPKITTDFSVNPEKLTIEKLIIQDQVSNASIKLGQKNRIMDVLFAGNLQKETLDNIIEKNEILKGQIKGDLYAHVLLDQPLHSTLKGELTVKDFIFPRKTKPSLVINDLFLTAKKDILQVKSAKLALADNSFDLKGNVNLSAAAPILDMELFANDLNLDQLKQDLDNNTKKSHNQTAEKSWAYPIRGMVKVKIENLTYNALTWKPFEADIRFNDKAAAVSITDANVCGITTLGILKITPQEITIDLKPSAQNQELNPSIRCLSDKSAKIIGNFNLEGNIKAKGTAQTLKQNINGDLKLYASKGRFHAGRSLRILIKIFSILDVTEIFKGKLSNPETDGFAYNSIRAKADIKNGKLVLNELIIDGSSMNIVCQGYIDVVNKRMDVTALVAPLKTIDFFIKKTPLIRDILGDSLISIPVGIKGHLENPRVTTLPPSKVGSGLLDIVKRTLQLPVKIIQPIPPPEESY